MEFQRIINFAAGPSKLPTEVLVKAQKDLLNHEGCGISVMELSHRSAVFDKVIKDAEKDLREILSIPDDYSVMFMQGGGTGQFAAIPLNFSSKIGEDKFDYLVSGAWSSKAAKEAEKYGKVNRVFPKTDRYTKIPDVSEWNLSKDAVYRYYCDNETIHGVEFPVVPQTGDNIPIVCDMSSNFLTRPIDVSLYGLIFAGAQKNIGIAGLTVVIVRNDLIGKANPICPTVFDYKTMSDNKSLYNTPPTFPIYITGLYLKWIKERGGIKGMQERSQTKSSLIYNVIENSNGFYHSPIEKNCRSRVTIPFRVGGSNGDTELEAKFLQEAKSVNLVELKGHRSVGGMRAALFNAMTIEETRKLEQFMINFAEKNRK